ncbi:MAG: hypothetical protein AAF715_15555 [Myxococcota bacterium]
MLALTKTTRTAAVVGLSLFLAACGSDDEQGGRDDGEAGPFAAVDNVPAVQFVSAVWSFGPDDVWVAADSGRMLHFTGAGWEEATVPEGVTVLDLWSYAPGELIGAGANHLVRFDGSDWSVEEVSGSGFFAGVWGSADDDIWLVGDQSSATHFDGTAWTNTLAAGPDNTVVWGSGPNDVYVASTFEVARYDGTGWTSLDDGDLRGGEAIFGTRADDVWIADGSQLFHLTDGTDLELIEPDNIGTTSALWGTAPDAMWGAGNFGSLQRYDGSSWEEVQAQRIGAPLLRAFVDLHGSGPSDIWAVGAEFGDAGVTPVVYRFQP